MSQELISPPLPVIRKLTYEEFLDRMDEHTHAEWVNGEIVYMSPINKLHNRLGAFLLMLIGAWVDEYHLGEVLYEPFQMKTGPDLPGRSPDILFIASENLTRLNPTYLDGPADLVVEIISPESITRDRREKFQEYEKGGVKEYWLLDPQHNQAEFYRLDEDGNFQRVQLDENGIFHSQALPGFWLKVEWLWQEPRPSYSSIYREWKLI